MNDLINRQDVIDLLYKLDEIRLKATGFPLNGFGVLLSETKKIPSATKRNVIEYLKDMEEGSE